jgi:hypothetical protein
MQQILDRPVNGAGVAFISEVSVFVMLVLLTAKN